MLVFGVCFVLYFATNRSNNLLHVFHWFLIQIHNFYSEQWVLHFFIEKVITEWWKQFILNYKLVETSYNCGKWCSDTTIKRLIVLLFLKAPWMVLMKCFHKPNVSTNHNAQGSLFVFLPPIREQPWKGLSWIRLIRKKS